MTFMTFGTSIRCPVCGVPYAQIGNCCSNILWPYTTLLLNYTAAEREEWLFTNRSNRPGDDMKDEVREATAAEAWQLWTAEWNRFARLRQHGPALVFPAEEEVLDRFFKQVRHEDELLALRYKGASQEVHSRGTKRRKQDMETPV